MSDTISTSVNAASIFSAEESCGLPPKRKDMLGTRLVRFRNQSRVGWPIFLAVNVSPSDSNVEGCEGSLFGCDLQRCWSTINNRYEVGFPSNAIKSSSAPELARLELGPPVEISAALRKNIIQSQRFASWVSLGSDARTTIMEIMALQLSGYCEEVRRGRPVEFRFYIAGRENEQNRCE
jgi:hypothetical protein